MRRLSIFWQVFSAVLAVTLGAIAILGFATRYALSAAFDAYLAGMPSGLNPMGRPRMGRMMLGQAETSFLSTVDRSVLFAAVIAIALSVAAAYVIARRLTRPIRELERAAMALAGGERSSRVEPSGPEEIQALGDAFNHMADSIEEVQELRRRLIADVAHELRNPIAAARAQAEGMAEGVLATDQARLGSLVEDMEHLSALVDDLQELALAEAGRLVYSIEPVDLSRLVSKEVERAVALAPEQVRVEALGTIGASVVDGDERRLSEVVRNLLANAVRHTASGSVTVEVRAVGDEYRVTVTDTGEGIPSEDLPYIFERFYRVDGSRAQLTGGAGLGLAISRQIVRDHHGDVFAGPASGGGTAIGFTVPAKR